MIGARSTVDAVDAIANGSITRRAILMSISPPEASVRTELACFLPKWGRAPVSEYGLYLFRAPQFLRNRSAFS